MLESNPKLGGGTILRCTSGAFYFGMLGSNQAGAALLGWSYLQGY